MVVLVGLVGAMFLAIRPSYLETKIEGELEKRTGLDATIGRVDVGFWPRPTLIATEVILREPASNLPPFMRIARVSTGIGPLSIWRRHVAHVQIEGLEVSVPPRRPGNDGEEDEEKANESDAGGTGDIIIDRLETRDTTLTILRSEPGREPLVFKIHELSLRDVGFDRVVPFQSVLTNPVPEGRVETAGWVGPWNREDPTDVALGGEYTFSLVKLATINGIGGALKSEGKYEGRLTRIEVNGTTETPDFSLDIGGQPVPLSTQFSAVVDGSNGSTTLERVDARLRDTDMVVAGSIDNLPGPGRRQIQLTTEVPSGRVEDLLALVIDAKPALTGEVNLKAKVLLPPGENGVRDRLQLEGEFGLPATAFTHPTVRQKVAELSRRSQGAKVEAGSTQVLGQIRGRFKMAGGRMSFPDLAFAVPGAQIKVQGTYGLAAEQLNMTGQVRMDATVSSAAGGFKGVLLKPFDWLFRRDGAGAVIPITITGSPSRPDVGVNIRRVITRG